PVPCSILCHRLLGRGGWAQPHVGSRVAWRSRLHSISSSSYYRLRSRRDVGGEVQPHRASNKVLGNVAAFLGSRWVVLVWRIQHVCRCSAGRGLTIRSSRNRVVTPQAWQEKLAMPWAPLRSSA